MKALQQIKDSKLSKFKKDLRHCETCYLQVYEKLGTYKQLAAEHAWAMEMIQMFETSYKECESEHEIIISSFVELKMKIQDIRLTLQEFKVKLEDATSKVKNFLGQILEHHTFLDETCGKVESENDVDQLESIHVPWKEWMWFIPDFESEPYEEMEGQWERMSLLSVLIELLLELRLLIDEVNAVND